MRRLILAVTIGSIALFLAGCGVDTTGLKKESSKGPTGNPQASVLVLEYGDLQCPACKSAYTTINKPLLEKYGKEIRFEFRQFPLTIHEYAHEAAEASECAADQGKFWEFVDEDYTHQEDLNSQALRDWAQALKLDIDLFDRCIRSGFKSDTVDADEKEGESIGVNATPTYVVNGQKVPKNTLEDVSNAIEAAKKQGGMPL